MTQFHEGQEVEVWTFEPGCKPPPFSPLTWRKAKIIAIANDKAISGSIPRRLSRRV